MKTFNVSDIRKLDPCTDPTKYVKESWTGTVIDILSLNDVPPEHRLWVAFHKELISAKTLRLFAVWCARQALALVENPDPRSVEACNVSERFALGKATSEELGVARENATNAYYATHAANAAAYAANATYAANAATYAAATNATTRQQQITKLIEMIKSDQSQVILKK
jgi:hypothetical protein